MKSIRFKGTTSFAKFALIFTVLGCAGDLSSTSQPATVSRAPQVSLSKETPKASRNAMPDFRATPNPKSTKPSNTHKYDSPLIVSDFTMVDPWKKAKSMDDGASIAGQPFALEASLNGYTVVFTYRVATNGSDVDRIIAFVSDEKTQKTDYTWNGSQIATAHQQMFHHENGGPTRSSTADPYTGQWNDMKSTLGPTIYRRAIAPVVIELGLAEPLALQGTYQCTAEGARGLGEAALLAIQGYEAGHSQGSAGPAPLPLANSRATGECMLAAAYYGASWMRANAMSWAAAAAGAGITITYRSWQSLTRIWDSLNRSGGPNLDTEIWSAGSGNCNATAGARACTSISAYLQY